MISRLQENERGTDVNRRQGMLPVLLLAAGIAGGMLVAGCSSNGVRQEPIATVNGDPIKVGELREALGVPAGAFAVEDIPRAVKMESLDRLVTARLLAQDGHSRGIDNTPEFQEDLRRNDRTIWIKALVRKEIEAKLKVTGEEIKAEIDKVRKANKGISDAVAAARAVKSLSGRRVQKIQSDLVEAAKKETGAAVDPQAVARIGKGENMPDDAVLASIGEEKILYGDLKEILRGMAPAGARNGPPDPSRDPAMIDNILERELTIRALAVYAKKPGSGLSEGYEAMRRETGRSVLGKMAADDVAGKNVVITDREIEAAYREHAAMIARNGKKIPVAMVAVLKERIRANLLNERGKASVDAYIDELRKKAKITVDDSLLSKV